MKSRIALTLLTVLFVGFASLAQAQPGPRGQGGPGGRGGPGGFGGPIGGVTMVSLLQIKAVQEELELTTEQVAEIEKLVASMRGQRGGPGGAEGRRPDGEGRRPRGEGRGEGRRPGGEGGREGGERPRRPEGNDNTQVQASSPFQFVAFQPEGARGDDAQRRERFEQFRRQAEERQQEMQAKLAGILLPHQLTRLREIYVQTAGVAALNEPMVAKELGVTDAQREKMGEVRREAFSKLREAFQGGDREGVRSKMEDMREDINSKVLGVLTAEQQKKFETMKGKKFDMPEGAIRSGFEPRQPDGQRGERRRPERATSNE